MSDHAKALPRPLRWPELAAVAAASGVVVALIWFDAALRGAVGIPRDDDWSYLRTIFDLAQTGSFALNGWVHMMFIGQAAPGALLVTIVGPSVTALQAANAVVALVALLLVYAIGRQLVSTVPALLITALLAVNPVFAHLVVTAMTDLPVLALQAGCLLCGLIAVRRERPSWPLTAGVLILGLAAFTIREYGAVVLLTVALVVIARFAPLRSARRYLVVLILLLLGCAGIAWMLWSWRRGLPNDIVGTPMPVADAFVLLCRASAVLGLMVAPVWAAVSWSNLRAALRRVPVLVPALGALGGALIVVVVLASGNQALGNILHPFGSTWTSVGDGIRSVPLWMFRGLQLLGYGSVIALSMTAALVTWLLLRQVRSKQRPASWQGRTWQLMLIVVVTVALLGSYVVATGLLGAPLIDRYFLLVTPLVGVLLLAGVGSWQEARARRLQGLIVAGTVVVASAIGFAFVDASAQVDGARWRLAEDLVAQGVDPAVIDAGDPWFRYHQQGAGRAVDDGTGRPWWVMFFPNSRACWTVVLTHGSQAGAWGSERTTVSLTTLLGEQGRLVVVPGPDACTD